MNKKKRLAAFTLLEITIAMLLVAILSGFAYYAFQIFVQLSQTQQIKKREKYSLEQFIARIETDWSRADSIGYTDNVLILQDTIGQIQFSLVDTLILREQYGLRIDTFYFSLQNIQTQVLQKQEAEIGYLQSLNAEIRFEDKVIPLQLFKTYSAEQLLYINTDSYDTN
jgi:prepilin-type N-terminal cleavage/methylation domain-containing protein